MVILSPFVVIFVVPVLIKPFPQILIAFLSGMGGPGMPPMGMGGMGMHHPQGGPRPPGMQGGMGPPGMGGGSLSMGMGGERVFTPV